MFSGKRAKVEIEAVLRSENWRVQEGDPLEDILFDVDAKATKHELPAVLDAQFRAIYALQFKAATVIRYRKLRLGRIITTELF